MQKLRYHITTISPVLLVSNTGDTNMVATREYIHGSAVLGLFAGEFIRKKALSSNAHTDPIFSNWFLNGGLRFTNAYIVSRDKENTLKNNLPVPISLQKEKKDEKTIHDLLLDELCKEQTKGIGGFGRLEGNRFYKQKVKKSLNFHHERDYEKGTTKKGVIFNYESIESGQTFEGEIIGNESDLGSFLSLFQNENIFGIGRSKGVQYGKIKFEFVSKTPEEIESNIDNSNGEISMTLLSDVIIYNQHGFSTTDVTELEEELKKTLGDDIEIDRVFVKAGETENFVSIWKLRRPSEVCFQMGSCFLIKGLSSSHKDKLLELEKTGIGERRGEGFGRVIFGWQIEDKLVLPEGQEDDKPKKPSIPLPEKSKEIAQTVIKDFIRKQVEIKALSEYTQFKQLPIKQLPTKSLIGRLETTLRQKNKVEFIEFVGKLREPAKDKLHNCHNGSESLFNFLQKEIRINDMITQHKLQNELQELCKELDIKPENDSDFASELYRTYFLVFFSQMRKMLKREV